MTLTGPKGCVPHRESFIARVTAKRLTLTRVEFRVDGKRQAVDRKAPFRQSMLQFNIPAGTTHTLQARVTGKRRGRSATRTLTVKFAYCSA